MGGTKPFLTSLENNVLKSDYLGHCFIEDEQIYFTHKIFAYQEFCLTLLS